ncbi:UDP-N-acetylmuramoyl-L-alanyl-D-glutamate--2,6-diaminopimelate ligase [Lentibacillus sp. CBA3610]|uniref:UDP-N-acetylmuramoyl-L-alanyl-D-glutamate--2, 6-diaminopimelate ligase n=1 Tax=Lentibacillus sp. CBA3610 TaxID=2518176 RepID=UPI0015950CBB|nr:UDP-N-acetylmuramoyl-L-alanyl-D-glutamate--2,6-diaminopimelate ligase [Lentibacillus sp. CBA3610]QKY68608.1 UDP-N-acetylmuramoyl-L-alanyl-D-glutamate--2,6-diaminopimelate ligase [Lentibacillus sp. CBA3610]
MKLQDILHNVHVEQNLSRDIVDLVIDGIAENSKDVGKGYVFVAIPGYSANGHDFIQNAIENGASVIIGDKDISGLSVPFVKVANSRKSLSILASNYYQNPASRKLMIGITGTNGKTTTSHLLKHILDSNGITCSVIGTNQTIINGESSQYDNTTPGSLVLQKLMADSNDDVIILEVSSHGLTQGRVDGIEFDFCLFTNLQHDHLDYHDSMETYFEAKYLLFDKLKKTGQAIVNIDNTWGNKLAALLSDKGSRCVTIGQSAYAHVRLEDFNGSCSGVKVIEENDSTYIHSPLPGMHNVYNTVMAFVTAGRFNVSNAHIISALDDFDYVEGRFEMFKLESGVTVVIDYAHTADALYHCLETVKQNGSGQIIHVFGFRGNRDMSKRRDMVVTTAELSDLYILTLDDLNSVSYEKMEETIAALNKNFGNEKGTVITDRTLAIKKAVEQANPGDWIVITGKGHEKYQQAYVLPVAFDKDTILYLEENLMKDSQ